MIKANFFNASIVFLAGILIGFLIPSVFGLEVEQSMDHSNMDRAMHDMTSHIEDLQGQDFDEAFVRDMIVHHEGAIDMAEMVLEKSNNPKLLRLAKDIITAQSTEIDMMNMWQEKGFDYENDNIPPTSGAGNIENPVACTADAKICPDGSAVGRVGPNCEFEKCEGEN